MVSRGRQQGFTLIEIMVVMVLVGLLVSLAVANLGGGNQYRNLEEQTRELFLLMQTAREQALLNNQELGLTMDEEGYRFLVFNLEGRKWQPQAEQLFSPRQWDLGTEATVETDDDLPRLMSEEDDNALQEDGEKVLKPNVVFFSSGETTPFDIRIELIDNAEAPKHQLTSDGYSDIIWRGPNREESATL